MSRLSSQGTKFYVQNAVLPAGTAMTAITKAAPAEITVAALPVGWVNGSVVVPTGTGWKSIDGKPFAISDINVPANTLELLGSDTTEELADAVLGDVALVPFGESCMATMTFTSPAGTTIDVTTLCDVARETIDGMPGVSTWSATGFWDRADPMQARLRALKNTGEQVAFRVEFNDGSGLVFRASVNQFDIRMGVDQAVAFTIGGNMSGAINDLAVAA